MVEPLDRSDAHMDGPWRERETARQSPNKGGRMETSSRDVRFSSLSEVRREERETACRNTAKRTEERHRQERSWLTEMMFGCET